jgi:uncharacterized membrane protein YsdA (DUF1294 family)
MANLNRTVPHARSTTASAHPTRGRSAAGVAAIFWALLAIAFVLLGDLSFYPAWLLAGTVATFGLFAFDKLRAKSGGWRVPERALLTFVLLGGVAGGWLGMLLLRHKTLHRRFWVVAWIATALHGVLLVWTLLR